MSNRMTRGREAVPHDRALIGVGREARATRREGARQAAPSTNRRVRPPRRRRAGA
jgi:hypothetical protein